MKLRRIFVLPEEFTPEGIKFSKQATKYLTQVLRLKAGDEIEVFDGRQKYLVRLVAASEGHIHGSIIESGLVEKPTRFEVVLAFSCVRPGPVEEILRHATELGYLGSCLSSVIGQPADPRSAKSAGFLLSAPPRLNPDAATCPIWLTSRLWPNS